MHPPRAEVCEDEADLAGAVAAALAQRLDLPGIHHLVLTGGGVGTLVLSRLADSSPSPDWTRTHLWWGDERFLPPGHPDRNETSAREALIDRISIPRAHVHPMPADIGQGADAAAAAYADELAQASDDGFAPAFDILLLGMGPEGHVASLFPHSDALSSASSTVGIHGSPKPPPTRISLTLAAIRSSAQVWIVAAGGAKAAAVAAAMAPGTPVADVPAAGARGRQETVFWLDRAAAGEVG